MRQRCNCQSSVPCTPNSLYLDSLQSVSPHCTTLRFLSSPPFALALPHLFISPRCQTFHAHDQVRPTQCVHPPRTLKPNGFALLSFTFALSLAALTFSFLHCPRRFHSSCNTDHSSAPNSSLVVTEPVWLNSSSLLTDQKQQEPSLSTYIISGTPNILFGLLPFDLLRPSTTHPKFVWSSLSTTKHTIRMNKLSNLGRDMRHWSGPGFGMSRQNQMNGMSSMPPHTKPTPSPALAPTPADSTIHYSFNIPFASDLAGPNTEDILYATANAVLRWTHPKDAPDDIPVWKLPVHTSNIEILSKLCAAITNGPLPILADVAVTTPKRPTASPAQVTTVTLSGSPELVHKSRETILNDTPIALV